MSLTKSGKPRKKRMTKAEKAAYDIQKAELQERGRLAQLDIKPTPPEVIAEDMAIFAFMGNSRLKHNYREWDAGVVYDLQERLQAAGGRIRDILTDWDEIALQEAEDQQDPKLLSVFGTPQKIAELWRHEAIIWTKGFPHVRSHYEELAGLATRDDYVEPTKAQRIVAAQVTTQSGKVRGGQQTGLPF